MVYIYIPWGRFLDHPTGKVLSMLLSKLIGPVTSENAGFGWGFLMADGNGMGHKSFIQIS